MILGGAEGTRTPDPHTASVVRYQLRHSPKRVPHRADAAERTRSLHGRQPRRAQRRDSGQSDTPEPRPPGLRGLRRPVAHTGAPATYTDDQGRSREPQGTGGRRRRRTPTWSRRPSTPSCAACSPRSRTQPPRARRSASLASSPCRSATAPPARAATRPLARRSQIAAANTVKFTAGSALKDAANK